jgi:hypothetical protein
MKSKVINEKPREKELKLPCLRKARGNGVIYLFFGEFEGVLVGCPSSIELIGYHSTGLISVYKDTWWADFEGKIELSN